MPVSLAKVHVAIRGEIRENCLSNPGVLLTKFSFHNTTISLLPSVAQRIWEGFKQKGDLSIKADNT